MRAWSLEKSHPLAYREDLARVLALLAEDIIASRAVTVLPLRDAAKAFEALQGHQSGKIVLTPER